MDEEKISGHNSEEVERDISIFSKISQLGRSKRIKAEAETKSRAEQHRQRNRSNRERSKDQERKVAKDYIEAGFPKARRVPGSGAFAGLPADVDPGEWFLAECKESRLGRLVIDPEWVRKIRSQAISMDRPFYAIHAWVGDKTGPYKKLVILDEEHFFQIIKMLKNEL